MNIIKETEQMFDDLNTLFCDMKFQMVPGAYPTTCMVMYDLSEKNEVLKLFDGEELFQGTWYGLEADAYRGTGLYTVFVEVPNGQVWYCDVVNEGVFWNITKGWKKKKKLLSIPA